MGGCGEIRHRDNNRLARKELHLNSEFRNLKNRYMKKNKKQLHEALAVLLTKLSSARENPRWRVTTNW